MKNVKQLFLLLGLATFTFGLLSAQSDPKADKILKNSQADFERLKDVAADFSFTLENPNQQRPIVKKGSVILQGDMYLVKFPDETIVSNGVYLWDVLSEDEEITKTDFDENTLSPARVFTTYKDQMKSRYDGLESGKHKITLYANDKTQDIWKTELKIDQKTNMVSGATMHNRNGTTYSYSLANVKTNQGVKEGTFVVNESKYEDGGWLVNDLTE